MQALAAADRTYVLETGGISLEGTGKELLNNPQVNLLISAHIDAMHRSAATSSSKRFWQRQSESHL
jgi:hypothetical protein